MIHVDASDGLAGAALVVSLYTLAASRRSQGHAHFTAEWQGREAILVRNHGPGLATSVRVSFPLSQQTSDTDTILETLPGVAALQTVRLDFHRIYAATVGPLTISWRDNRVRGQQSVIYLGQGPMSPLPRPPSTKPIEERVAEIARAEIDAEQRWRDAHG